MSTANFARNPEPFPIYAVEEEALTVWVCPDCDAVMAWDGRAWTCPICGRFSDWPGDEGAYRDECAENDRFEWIGEDLAEAVGIPEFYRVSLRSGYYSGAQVLVEVPEDPRELDNEECRDLFGSCRSATLRRFGAETRRLRNALDSFAYSRGFERLGVAGVFSNGSAVYEKMA